MTQFIDVHVHPPTERFLTRTLGALRPTIEAAAGGPVSPMSVDDLAALYRDQQGKAVLLGWDAETATKGPPLTSAEIAHMVQQHPDVFIGFGSVDPHKGARALSGVSDARRLGLKGLAFHPSVQRFDPADKAFASLWEVAEELRLIVLVHAGFTQVGAGLPGGGGVVLEWSRPMRMDRVAAAHPDLQIVLAGAAWPWVDEAVAVAMHKPNVWIDLTGWSPKRGPSMLLDAVRGPLTDRTLFGTDFPLRSPDQWIAEWDELGVSEALTRKVLVENATRLLEVA